MRLEQQLACGSIACMYWTYWLRDDGVIAALRHATSHPGDVGVEVLLVPSPVEGGDAEERGSAWRERHAGRRDLQQIGIASGGLIAQHRNRSSIRMASSNGETDDGQVSGVWCAAVLTSRAASSRPTAGQCRQQTGCSTWHRS